MRTPPVGVARALVVGVYPSAFHVAWSPPSALDPRPPADRRRPFIASLAVDVEPVVFWDGVTPSPEDLLEQWIEAVGFDPDLHGSVRVGHNGPSGSGLIDRVLTPLGLSPDRVAFTDAVPWFFVKSGKGSQGDAIATRFGPLAPLLGVHEGSLPARPSTRALVGVATGSERRDTLRAEIIDADAELVITLGQEALDAVAGVADESSGHQTMLSPDGYGQVGTLRIASTSLRLLPLAHPGFVRQTSRSDWREAFARFEWSPPDGGGNGFS